MARIRSIKPEFCTLEQVMEVSRDARLTFILMWPFCDDGGVHPASLKVLKAEIYPADDDVTTARIAEWLDDLLVHGLLGRFAVGGQQYLYVTGWKTHQRIEKPQPLRYPQPTSEGAVPLLDLFGGGQIARPIQRDPEPVRDDYGSATEPLPPEGRKEGREVGGERKEDSVPKGTGAAAPIEKQVFDTGKAILGKNSGGLIAKLRRTLDGDDARVLRTLELAATKNDPAEYIGRIVAGEPTATDDEELAAIRARRASMGVIL